MKWKKIGKRDGLVFKPEEYGLTYAKSPQAVVFDEFIRIYFSTCTLDSKGKYISDVAYVDMDKKFTEIITISTDVISRGKIGCFDEHGIFPFSPVRIGESLYAYISGWSRRVSVSTDSGIGIAISKDQGKTFTRLGDGPILTSSIEDPFLVIDGFVRKYEGELHMWYIFGTRWKMFEDEIEPQRIYKIGHARSKDGLLWTKDGKALIEDKVEDECQALPTVVEHKGVYHMFFCYRYPSKFRNNRDRSYRLGYAFSYDLINWTRDDASLGLDVGLSGWASNMLCYPNAFVMDNKMYILYNGNDFGKSGFGVAVLEEF